MKKQEKQEKGKKGQEEQIVRNILIAAGMLVILSFLLLFGLGAGLYQNIVKAVHSAGGTGFLGANIYDVYYYKCFDLLYRIFYSVSLSASVLAALSLLCRKNGALWLAKLAFAAQAVTAVYVLISCILEDSVTAHRIAAGLYIQDIAASFEVTKMLGRLPLIASVILLVAALGGFVFIRLSVPETLKIYAGGGWNVRSLLIPVLYGSIFMETVRPLATELVCAGADSVTRVVYDYIKDYYFAQIWDFGFPYVWFLLIFCVGRLVAERKGTGKNTAKMTVGSARISYGIAAGILLLLVIRAVLYFVNPPRLFGYLTLDEAVCDAVEAAYPAYIVMFIADVVLLLAMLFCLFGKPSKEKNWNKMLPAACGIHAAASIVGVLLGRVLTPVGIFVFCAAIDLILSVCLLYMADIRGRHH